MKKSINTKKHKKFCEVMVKARKDAGLTQQELANKLKRPQSFISKYESGERRLDLIELEEITSHLNITIHDLITNLQ